MSYAEDCCIADKIDFTTIKATTGMPVSTANVDIGFGAKVNISRIGNLVLLCYPSAAYNQYVPRQDGMFTVLETIPEGYRPMTSVELPCRTDLYTNIDYAFGSSGGIQYRKKNDNNIVGQYPLMTASWITNDPWPTTP